MALFITFEGIEGCGKSTQIDLLAGHFLKNKIPFIKTREPGGTLLGEKIRPLLLDRHSNPVPMAELLLYSADRAQHCAEKILPALKEGKMVLCDRFIDSTLAYQHGGRKIDLDLIEQLIHISTNGLRPHLTLLFDCPVELGLGRAKGRNQKENDVQDRFENLDLSFHQAVRDEYLRLAKKDTKRFCVLDASLSIAEIFERVLKAVNSLSLTLPRQRGREE
ncbi:MAG: dTMP kinase [Deltaproteobacteria bacterium]|nr:dTMP kinase [Deltaproteobacteria bacterium]